MTRPPLIIAHRGASHYAPENTIAAIKMAVDDGAEGVEFDVRLAGDGIPVVIHDATLDRTGLNRGRVSDLTSNELCQIDVGSWFNVKYPKRAHPNFASETIPTLSQVLHMLGDFHGRIYVELKAERDNFNDLVKAVCDIVGGSPLLPQVIIKSFSLAALPEIKKHLSGVQTAALFEPALFGFMRLHRSVVKIACDIGADRISVHHSLVNRKLVTLAAKAQLPVTVWTSDNPTWIKRCQLLGIEALITNDPAKMLKCRDEVV